MIANLLPSEATHSSLDLFEKPSLLVTFDGSFCQKLGPIYSPNGPMLEFEVAGDRNNFIDLQKIFLEVKCKIVQSSEADLKYDATAAADITKTDSPYFCNNVLHSLFSDCTVSANGLKISNANGNYAHKSFIETEFSHNKDAKNTRLACQGYSYEENPGTLSTAESFGTHWLLLCQKEEEDQLYFADPLGQSISSYKDVYQRIISLEENAKIYQLLKDQPIQSKNSKLCGLFCIYIAHYIFNSQKIVKLSDAQLIRFAFHMLY